MQINSLLHSKYRNQSKLAPISSINSSFIMRITLTKDGQKNKEQPIQKPERHR